MKLYYSPGACSLVPRILINEIGVPCDFVRVNLAKATTETGADYKAIASKGSVPLLELANGELLSEGPVIGQYLCDQAGRTDLMPAAGTMARYRVMEWQNFITSELHKSFSPLFNPAASVETKAMLSSHLHNKFKWLNAQLVGRSYLTSDTFTAADAYLFVVASWSKFVNLDLSAYPELNALLTRVAARPAVHAALQSEGLLG